MLKEARSYLAEVGVIIVVLLLQVSHKAHLKSVDVFNVPKDDFQLLVTEHVPSLAALLQVALQTKKKLRVWMSSLLDPKHMKNHFHSRK